MTALENAALAFATANEAVGRARVAIQMAKVTYGPRTNGVVHARIVYQRAKSARDAASIRLRKVARISGADA